MPIRSVYAMLRSRFTVAEERLANAPSLPIQGMAAHRADGGDCEHTEAAGVCLSHIIGRQLGSERWGAPPPLPRGHGQRRAEM